MNRLLLALPFLAVVSGTAFAESGTAVLTASSNGALFHYDAVLNNTSTDGSPLGTFWFAWVPGDDFLPTSPTDITSPAGWQAFVTNGGPSDGFAIQWTAKTGDADLAAGSSLSGFSFDTGDTPAQLQGNSPFFPAIPTTTSFVYTGAPFSDNGHTFIASVVAAPTPEPASLGVLALGGLLLFRRKT